MSQRKNKVQHKVEKTRKAALNECQLQTTGNEGLLILCADIFPEVRNVCFSAVELYSNKAKGEQNLNANFIYS